MFLDQAIVFQFYIVGMYRFFLGVALLYGIPLLNMLYQIEFHFRLPKAIGMFWLKFMQSLCWLALVNIELINIQIQSV